jgi:hypothetical protein
MAERSVDGKVDIDYAPSAVRGRFARQQGNGADRPAGIETITTEGSRSEFLN